MAKARLSLLPFLFMGFQSNAQVLEGDPIFNDPGYHQVASIEFFDSKPVAAVTEVPNGIGSDLCAANQPLDFDPMTVITPNGISLDKIINIGKMLWEIVKANRARVDIKVDAATAIPRGLGCWTDLTKFSNARSEYRTMVIRNFARMKAVEFQYRMIWLPGGSYKGKGKYIGYATMIPSNVYVIAGWSLDAHATMPAVYNQGTASKPVAALNMNMVYRAESHFSVTEQSQSYQIDGTGGLTEL